VAVFPKPASSVILLRPGPTSPIEAYLIRRARGMRFLGGFYAFPGGKVDLADSRPEILRRTRGLDPARAAVQLGEPDGAVPAVAYWVTALRELFEETGLLLAEDARGRPVAGHSPDLADRLEIHRRALTRGERSLAAILEEEDWVANLAPLTYLAHFVTPLSSPIRFSARFFLCPVPEDQAPRLILEETSEGFWVEPAAAYARFRAGEWPMAEPAEYGMRYLAQFESWAALWAHHGDGRPRFDGIIDRLDADLYRLARPSAAPAS
jgi:8-oxo-dGTP pyrophosphatase MutT (NUDIX family)